MKTGTIHFEHITQGESKTAYNQTEYKNSLVQKKTLLCVYGQAHIYNIYIA